MDRGQEQSDLGPNCLSKRFQNGTTKHVELFVICVLRVNKCEFGVYTIRIS